MKKITNELILQGFVIFIITFVLSIGFIVAFMNPIVQDVYNKGYQLGKNESCTIGNFIENSISQNWNDNSPTGDSMYDIDVNFSI